MQSLEKNRSGEIDYGDFPGSQNNINFAFSLCKSFYLIFPFYFSFTIFDDS